LKNNGTGATKAAEAGRGLLRHPRVQSDGTMLPELISGSEIDEALEIVRRLVGYAPQVIGGGRPFHNQEPES
jgi:hypothetical protein